MVRILGLGALLLLAACNGNDNHPVGAPSGIRAESGGGMQQLEQVPGNRASVGSAGVVSRTRVQ